MTIPVKFFLNWIRFGIALIGMTIPLVDAQPKTSLCRLGEALYPPNFQNFKHGNPDAPKGGDLNLSAIGSFDTLNWHVIGSAAAGIMGLTFDALMYRTPEEPFTLYPLIAEKVDVSSDSSSVTFFIHPKACFQDGTPITAEDIQFSYETLRDHGLPRYRQFYSMIKRFQILNSKTIRLILSPKNGQFDSELPMILALMRPLSKKQLQKLDFTKTGMTPLVGSGAYQIDKVDPGRSITYRRLSNYWAKDLPVNRGHNNFDRIHITYFQNIAVERLAFLSGEVDVHFETDPQEWEKGYSHKAVKEGLIQKLSYAHSRPVSVRTILMNLRRPIFSNWSLRQALALAFDFETLNQVVFQNSLRCPHSLFANTPLAHQGKPSKGELILLKSLQKEISSTVWNRMMKGPFVPAQTKGDGDQRTNLEQADRLLKQAGFRTNRSGRRLQQNGKPLILELMVKDPRLEKVALSFQKSLKKLGIELKVIVLDQAQYEKRVVNSDFDLIVHCWSNNLSPGQEQVYYFSRASADIPGSSNYLGLKDYVAEKLASNVPKARSQEELQDAVHALDRYIMHQVYQIPFCFENTQRIAYWKNRLAFIGIQKSERDLLSKVGVDIIRAGWVPPVSVSKTEPAVAPQSSSWLSRIWKALKSWLSIL
jgi:microcin C transport system substrate-binding protein